MSTYITADDYTYIVKDENAEKAIAFLKEWVECEVPKAAALGDGRSVITASNAPFDGEVPWSWGERVEEFLGEHCEDGSHAAFRSDDEFEWRFYWKEDGNVHVDSEGIGNPFWARQQEMDRENGILDFLGRLVEAGVL